MADILVPNSFIDETDAQAAEVNENFDVIETWVNAQAVHRDASKNFTAIPSGPATNPTNDNQFTRKGYVDNPTFLATASGTLFGTGGATLLVPGWSVERQKGIALNGAGSGFTVTAGGAYLVGCNLNLATSTAGNRRNLGLRVNSGTMFVTDSKADGNFTSGFGNGLAVISMVNLTAGQSVNALYQHDSLGLDFTARIWAIGLPWTLS